MANIKIELDYELIDGQPVTFAAPCNCTEVTGLKVYHAGGSNVFTFKDAHGNALTGLGNLFSKGAYVKAILDVNSGSAYLQNADTNAYLEAQLASKAPAGYGLGAWAKLTTDLNSTKECGWYFFGSSAANKPPYSGVGVLLVLNRNYTYEVTQIAWEITTGVMTQRVYNTNSWSSWEFVNPPMSEGVEYRTTERIDGKAVYKKNVDGVIQYRLDGETTWHNYSDAVGAAPAGYGLGSDTSRSVSDCNTATKIGFYGLSGSSATNYPADYPNFRFGTLFVERRSPYLVQTIRYNSLVAMRFSGDGGATWKDWKYVNPPYADGVEYATTDYIGDKMVYKKMEGGVLYYRKSDETEWKPQNALMGSAPAGYGLGTTGPTVSDANHVFEVFRNGWYRTISSTANTAVTHGAGIALVYDANRAFHLLAKTTAGTMRTRYTPNSDGVFVEDLINPPMTASYEYQTIERWSGKTVYTKRISFGQLPASNYAEVSTGITGGTLVSLTGTFYDDAGGAESYPIITSSGVKCMAWVENGCSLLTVQVLSDCSKYTGEFVIKYTKN